MISTDSELNASIVEYCSIIGCDPLLVQGAGGNASWKDGKTLWVKASGTWLAEAAEKDIFVPVNLCHLSEAIKEGSFDITPKLVADSLLRPSIETLLHALMPHKIVIHLHAIEVLAFMVRDNCFSELKSLLSNSIRWTMVEYHKPGAGLAAAVNTALFQNKDTHVVFLKNHGLVIGADTVKGVASILEKILSVLITPLDIDPIVIPDNVPQTVGEYKVFQDTCVQQLAVNNFLFNRLSDCWVLYPDHVVFLGAKPCIYGTLDAFLEGVRAGKEESDLIFVLGVGVFVKSDFNNAKSAQLRCYYDVLVRQSLGSSMRPLTTVQIDELLSWDAERYRKRISK
jgi:rhamnose utilization protein RhaD (predicted bifunctional aldolase and dehydrogenase)